MNKNPLTILMALMPVAVFAATSTNWVDSASTAVEPDGSPERPFKDIQSGINAYTTDNNYVVVKAGTYYLEHTITNVGNRAVYIVAEDPDRTRTVIDGQGLTSCVRLGNKSRFIGFTVRNGIGGQMPGSGHPFDTFRGAAGIGLDGHSLVSNCWVHTCVITTEHQRAQGGGIFINQNASVYDTLVEDCKAIVQSAFDAAGKKLGDGCCYGGGIAADARGTIVLSGVTVRRCEADVLDTTENNGAYLGGAGLATYQYQASTSLTVENCVFEKNRLGDGIGCGSALGGGVLLAGGVFRNNIVRDNVFRAGGVGVHASGAATVSDCTFTGNYGRQNSSTVALPAGSSISGCYFESNTNQNYGALNINANSTVSNCVFRKNVAMSSAAALCLTPNNTRVTHCLIEDNVVTANNGTGAGIKCDIRGIRDLTVDNCVIRNNTVKGKTSQGSAFYGGCKGQNPITRAGLIRNCLITGNEGGSCLYFGCTNNMPITVESCTLVDNVCSNTLFALHATYCAESLTLKNNLMIGTLSRNSASSPDIPAALEEIPANVTYCATSAEAGPSTESAYHNLLNVQNPKFVDYASGDYRPSSASPVARAGFYDASWMDGGALDLGTMTYVRTATGVEVVCENARPRRANDGTVAIGCYAAAKPKGLLLIVH